MTLVHRLGRAQGPGDLVLAAVATVSILGATGQIAPTGDELSLDPLGYVCVVVAGGSLALRRRWPLVVVGAVTAALVVYLARGYPGGPVFVTSLVALYSLAVQRTRRFVPRRGGGR